ncbi:hypothetical protein [Erythrobacter sp. MTPC3]|uniref:hypothetical protein n=1 Tax=Erythrobacter sp. MTPC3 TaxID=3056564 RepID=UPI0036F3F7F0
MKRIKTALAAATIALAASAASPALAQDYPLKPGEYVQMNGIYVEDGGELTYAEWLATEWKKFQEYAKSQGWISDYGIYANVNPREGEPNIYLVVQFASIPDAAEQERRDKAFDQWSRTTVSEQVAASGNRAEYRTVISSMLLQEYTPR